MLEQYVNKILKLHDQLVCLEIDAWKNDCAVDSSFYEIQDALEMVYEEFETFCKENNIPIDKWYVM